MKSKLPLASAIIAIFTLGIIFLPAQDDATTNIATEEVATVAKWEHLGLPHDATKAFSTAKLARQINKLGEEGWELVNVLNFQKEGTTTKTVYYFKRPL